MTLVQQRGTGWGWEWGPRRGCACVHAWTSVCERAHVCAAQTDSNRQRFQERLSTVLIAAACGSYKYSDSRTKIGIFTLLCLQKSLYQAGKTCSSKPRLRSTSPALAGPSSQPLGHHVPLTLCVRLYPHAPHGPCQPAAISGSVQISHPHWKRGHGQQIGEGTALGVVSQLGTAACLLPTSLLGSSRCCFPVLLMAWFKRTGQWEGGPGPTEPPALVHSPGDAAGPPPTTQTTAWGKASPPKTPVGRQKK